MESVVALLWFFPIAIQMITSCNLMICQAALRVIAVEPQQTQLATMARLDPAAGLRRN
jgi:hypothetical protein